MVRRAAGTAYTTPESLDQPNALGRPLLLATLGSGGADAVPDLRTGAARDLRRCFTAISLLDTDFLGHIAGGFRRVGTVQVGEARHAGPGHRVAGGQPRRSSRHR